MSWDILSKANLQYLLTRLKVVTDSITRGHIIKNSSGTSMTSRDDLKFSGYLKTTDDSTNDCTVISDEPTPITWTNYQALTDAQRSGNKYLITDYPKSGGHIPYTGSDVLVDNTNTSFEGNNVQEVLEEIDGRLNSYSTTEKVIGTWIDGKPLYQKTLTGTYSSSQNVDISVADLDIETIMFDLSASFRIQSDGNRLYVGYYFDSSDKCQCYYNKSLNCIRLQKGGSGTAYVTIRYTKTSD